MGNKTSERKIYGLMRPWLIATKLREMAKMWKMKGSAYDPKNKISYVKYGGGSTFV